MSLVPISKEQRTLTNQNLRRLQKRRLPPTSANRIVERDYHRELKSLVKALEDDVKSEIITVLKLYEAEYTADASYSAILKGAFEKIRNVYNGAKRLYEQTASKFVLGGNAKHKQAFYISAESAIAGSASESLIRNEDLTDEIISTTRENVSLITSIPEKYLTNIESIVWSGTNSNVSAEDMVAEIMKQTGSTYKRARFIAKDQTAKLTATLNRARQRNLGIEWYIWRTRGDDKVRPEHAKNNGKMFRWDSPPKDTGHPGTEAGCRCLAQPAI